MSKVYIMKRELHPGWEVLEEKKLRKSFPFANFNEGMKFANAIARMADEMNHHPDLIITYPSVTVELTTHDAGGLTDKDFQLASEIETYFV